MLYYWMRKLYIIPLLLISLSGFFFAPAVSGTEKPANHDCISCHKITNEEAASLLREIVPDVKVNETRALPAKGLWELDVEAKGQKAIIYVDFSKKYLFSGSFVEIKTKENLTQNRLAELNKVDVSQIPLDDALIMGAKDAKHRIIVFTDPDCPYCEKLHHETKKVIEKRKDIAFYVKMYPLPFHKGADVKAKTIICEKSLALLEDAFAKKSLPAPNCDTKAVDENMKLAEKLGIRGTPAIILPNGLIIPGYRDAESLIEAIDKQSGK